MKEKTGFKKGWRGGPGRGKKMVANDCPPPFSGEPDKPKRDSKTKDEKSTVGMLSTLLSVPMREARKLVKFKRAVDAGHIKEDVVAKVKVGSVTLDEVLKGLPVVKKKKPSSDPMKVVAEIIRLSEKRWNKVNKDGKSLDAAIDEIVAWWNKQRNCNEQ